ncbi:5-oxoprolinase subunit C family protein [Streptomyces malaysiensis]|uniref:5-oxoprolinase subunit C family protein n=1 Tax=Streptomyces malaysiensis TaxID=92644 RepID=UPI002B2CE56A|nr:biotin-dependent carboxyltransferase family protein [Streptomyces malaysiensis]
MADRPELRVESATACVVTDLGRVAGPARGLAVNGALDQFAARAANALVGNAPTAPLIEATGFGVTLRPSHDVLMSITGAPAEPTVDGRSHPAWAPLSVRAGEKVRVGISDAGLRAYVAVHGSFDVPRLMGSCAPDSMIGFGTHVTSGTCLSLLRSHPPLVNRRFGATVFDFGIPRDVGRVSAVLDAVDGPDAAEFGPGLQRLYDSRYTVTPRIDHVGLRVAGHVPQRSITGEVLSRGVPIGAVEAPAGDELLVLMRGRGITAGYPVLAVLTSRALDNAAQLRPGQQIRFRRTTAAAATAAYLERRRLLDRIALRARTAFAELR